MSKQIESVRSGLVAMKTLLSRDPCIHADVAIGMIDAMLAEQPAQQEPLAWMYTSHLAGNQTYITRYASELTTYKADKVTPLYTTPQAQPAREPLTDEEIKAVIASIDPEEQYMPKALQQFARAIEAKLKEKNT